MADSLKVFKNDSTAIAVASAVTIPIVTTNATSQAVVKEIAVALVDTSLFTGLYKFPAKLKLGTTTVASATTLVGAAFSGSQIVDVSSGLDLEVGAETQLKNWGTMSAMVPLTDGTYLFSYGIPKLPLASTSLPTNAGTSIITNATKTKVAANTFITGTSGFTIIKSGVMYYCSTTGTTLTIRRADFTVLTTVAWGANVHWACVDGLYIYGKSDTAAAALIRINIDTLAVTTLTLNASIAAMGASNPGFMDSYSGFVYLREAGNTANIAKIDLSTGAVTRVGGATTSAGEHIGGLITVNTSGIPYLIEYADANWNVWKITDFTNIGWSGQVWGNDPSTTNSNTLFNVANGIVLVSNSTYNTSALIDVNGAAPTITLATALFSPNLHNSTSYAYISSPFKTAPVDLQRTATCNIVASGISVT
jgi:hypothetical protein